MAPWLGIWKLCMAAGFVLSGAGCVVMAAGSGCAWGADEARRKKARRQVLSWVGAWLIVVCKNVSC